MKEAEGRTHGLLAGALGGSLEDSRGLPKKRRMCRAKMGAGPKGPLPVTFLNLGFSTGSPR